MQLNNDQQQVISVDKDKISNHDDAELRALADRLNVTKVKLKAAINAVGPSAKAVEAYLNRKKI
jgi:hypothetical protein